MLMEIIFALLSGFLANSGYEVQILERIACAAMCGID